MRKSSLLWCFLCFILLLPSHAMSGGYDLLWTHEFDIKNRPRLTRPVIAGKTVCVGSNQGMLHGLDMGNGKKKWSIPVKMFESFSPLSSKGNSVFVGTKDGYITSVDGGKGKVSWNFLTGGDTRLAPVPVRGEVFGVTNYYDRKKMTWYGYLWRINGKTGEEIKRFILPGKAFRTSPRISGTHAYIIASDDTLYKVDMDEGKILWSFRRKQTPSNVYLIPEKRGSGVILQFPRYLYRVSGKGEYLWRYFTGGAYIEPWLSGNTLYGGLREKGKSRESTEYLVAIDLEKGVERWKVKIEAPQGAPLVSEGRVYTGTGRGKMYTFDGKKGDLIWEFTPVIDRKETRKYKPLRHVKKIEAVHIDDKSVYGWSKKGHLFAIDKNNGTQKWVFMNRDGFLKPIFREGKIFITTGRGKTFAIR